MCWSELLLTDELCKVSLGRVLIIIVVVVVLFYYMYVCIGMIMLWSTINWHILRSNMQI